ncbi:MAG: hypothetical protein U5R49_00530 [Deltaproteobacteria bacterium]|nr:hypothetical protein [Deltaproteobacteria bacterium]
MPNDFAEAHWLIDYRFGFMKRGLIGSICSLVTECVGVQMNPSLIAILSVITLSGLFATMLYLIARMILREEANSSLVLGLVFASSPFVVISAHLLGYFDSLLYVLGLASVGLVLSNRPFFAAFLSTVAILTHESYLLIGLPLVFLASVAVVTQNSRQASWKAHLVAICITVSAFIAVTLVHNLTTDPMVLRSQLSERLDSFGFVSTRSEGIALWHTTSFMSFFRGQRGVFGERLLNPVILSSCAPTLLAILVFIHSSFRIRAFSPFSIMVFAIVCAPLSLHSVAWDTARISTYTIGSGFIAAWILSETRQVQPAGDLFILIALPVLILNVFGRIALMDNEAESFSNMLRFLLYLPAIAFFVTTVVQNVREDWLKEFKEEEIPKRAIESNREQQ